MARYADKLIGIRKGGGVGSGGIGSLIVPQSASFSTGIGKGLREPAAPYRSASVFGADLNIPDANNWNSPPEIVDPTTAFDLSQIELNHEVAVDLVTLYGLAAGKSYWVIYQWFRDRENKLLFKYDHQISDPGAYGYYSWSWAYVYSYIGYVPWEINENGGYHVEIWLDQTLLQRTNFTVSGIPTTPQVSEFKIADFSKA